MGKRGTEQERALSMVAVLNGLAARRYIAAVESPATAGPLGFRRLSKSKSLD